MSKFLVVLVVGLIQLGGCANQPQTLGALPPDPSADAVLLTQHPMYDHMDKFSFTLATVKYPAGGGGSHIIPVGNFLLAKAMDLFQPMRADRVKLERFSAPCRTSSFFLPEAICTADYAISFERNGQRQQIEGTVERNIGNVRVKSDNLFFGLALHVEYKDTEIEKQVRKLMDAVADDIASKIEEGHVGNEGTK